jgi:hypothetical protein
MCDLSNSLVTPEKFCWFYAVGCLESRYHDNTLTHNEYREALGYVAENIAPPANLIRKWFPKPFKALEKEGRPCSLEQMQKYWREAHRSNEECTPVFLGTVTSVTKTLGGHVFGRVRVQNSSNDTSNKHTQMLLGQDVHSLGITVGDTVYIHASIIAEKVS